MPTWNCLRLFSDTDGLSRVDTTFSTELSAVDFAPPAPPLFLAQASEAKTLVFVELPVGWQGGWHASPKEQWVVCLAGQVGYRAGDGTEFMLEPGSCIFTSDTHGQGHNSWNAGREPVRLAVIQVQ